MNTEKYISVGKVALVVAGEMAISFLVGVTGTYENPQTLAGVMLFIGLEALRHWRVQMRRGG
ncbi:hypothetical protein MUU46_21075 [Scandinavium sp. TWS1a]|uniref:hypothetical protein n=1 Tax=Scandinavium tedordense TaxID=2926521 RepID=UPI00216520CF|nr:hypothetical protein [Scandinavium tedordense]MCS2172779.1 hypothetical protein [Scandinavium tedordense]